MVYNSKRSNKVNMVKDALELKHPPQSEPSPEDFVLCDDFPVLIDVDVTATGQKRYGAWITKRAGKLFIDA